MGNPKSSLQSSAGFTLIEMMIILGIFLILVAIGISKFSSYSSRARQGEAKIALTAIYSGEKAFFENYGAYIEDLRAVNYEPDNSKRHYTIGWRSPTVANVVTNYTGPIGQPYYDYSNIPAHWGQDDNGTDHCTITNARAGLTDASAAPGANPQTFLVKARGVLRKGLDCDEWQMDHTKALTNPILSL